MRKSGLKTRLARARVIAGLTQVEFSKITGISIDQIRHFERGGRPMTSFAFAMFGQMLGVSAAWLAGIGDENEPVALDGEPYTHEKYLENKARGLQEAFVKWNRDEMDSGTRMLLTQRAQAWKIFLGRVLTAVFSTEVDWLGPLDQEEIGLKVLGVIREYIHQSGHPVECKLSSLSLAGDAVDAILRDLRAKWIRPVAQGVKTAEQPAHTEKKNNVTKV